ncbi:MAG: CehA/McbA family metallohydrolase [Deltaproteobacteria bacterium]|nr:CehA/McbA family metallohydrolase [Deltaproteobacteria bacterium]
MRWFLAFALLAGCNSTVRRAQRLQAPDVAALGLRGDAIDARHGDIVMRSHKAIAVIQKPQRDMGPTPYGGNLIDFALTDDRIDRLGEMQPFLNLGRTAAFDALEIISDGSDGGPAIVEARGRDALIDFINVPAVRPDLLSYNGGNGLLRWDPNAPVPITFRARYTLGEDDDFLRVHYTVTNHGDETLELQAGVSLDAGGAVKFFSHERGFSGISGFSLQAFQAGAASNQFSAIMGDDVAYGIRAIGEKSGRGLRSVGLSIAGVAVLIATEGNLFDVLNAPTLVLAPHGSRTYAYEIQLARSVAGVRGRLLEREDEPGFVLSGRVANLTSRLPSADFAFFLRDGDKVEAVVPLDQDGGFSATLPPARYEVAIDAPSLVPLTSPVIDLSSDTDVTIDAGKHGQVTIAGEVFADLDSQSSAPRPCRITVLSQTALPTFRVSTARELARPAYETRFLPECAGGLTLPEGVYLIQASLGPAYDVFAERVVVRADAPVTLAPRLHRIFSPVIAADFHQHSVNSPDSNTPLDVRALGYAAEGIDFFASSDHDRITDYTPVLAALGIDTILQASPGVECTTFSFGHFNAWPLPPNPALTSGGTIDWGRETDTLLPRDIFAAMRGRGAAIVQVNHPRNNGGDDFQSFFDRAGLTVDPDKRVLGSDPLLQPVPSSTLRLPEGEPLFDKNFDAVELLNGFNFTDEDGDGRLDEYRANLTLRDFVGFLAQGFHPAIVGVSDSHTAWRALPGYPRTYVQTDGGAFDGESVAQALKQGRAVASNTPLLDVRALGKDGTSGGLGALVRTTLEGTATIEIRAEMQQPSQIDRFEVFVNTWVKTPGVAADGSWTKVPLPPTAIVDVVAQPVTRPNGGVVYVATASLPITVERDAFVVVRASGKEPMFPFIIEAGGGTPNLGSTSAADFFATRTGPPGLAVANPVYLDRNGNGAYDPPAL